MELSRPALLLPAGAEYARLRLFSVHQLYDMCSCSNYCALNDIVSNQRISSFDKLDKTSQPDEETDIFSVAIFKCVFLVSRDELANWKWQIVFCYWIEIEWTGHLPLCVPAVIPSVLIIPRVSLKFSSFFSPPKIHLISLLLVVCTISHP